MATNPCAILCIDCPDWDDELGLCGSTTTDYSKCPIIHELDGV